MNQRKFAWAGVIAPPLFVGIFTLEGWLRPDYQPLRMYVSELSLGPRGWIQMVNFIIFGLLLFEFTLAVAAEFQSGIASRGGIAILRILAICYLLSGPFVTDPSGIARNEMTIHGTLHGIFGAIVFSLMPVAPFVFLRRFRKDPIWQFFQWETLTLGTIIAAAVILLSAATKIPAAQNLFIEWLGFIQRAAIVPFMVWIFSFALGLIRRNGTVETLN